MRIAPAMTLAIATIGAATFVTPQALAQQQPTPEQAVTFLDYNRDGKVELNEYLNFQLPRLAQNDGNANGRLSRQEFEASLAPAARKNADRSFRAFDADKDNGLESREFLGYHAFVFKNYIDTDKDGFMSAAEWSAIMAASG